MPSRGPPGYQDPSFLLMLGHRNCGRLRNAVCLPHRQDRNESPDAPSGRRPVALSPPRSSHSTQAPLLALALQEGQARKD